MVASSLKDLLARPLHAADIRLAASAIGSRRALGDLIVCLHSAHRRTAVNAAWVMTHLPAKAYPWLQERHAELRETALSTADDAIRRLALTLLERLKWTEDDVETEFLDFCMANITRREMPAAVRVLCIKLAHKQCMVYPELRPELLQTLQLLGQEPLPPALRSIVRRVEAYR